jgi:surface protein
MLESRHLTQTIKVNIYGSASDLPSEWDNFIASTFKALPWIFLGIAIVAGLVALTYLYIYLIKKYRNSIEFRRDFACFNVVVFLGLAGVLYTAFPSSSVYFAQPEITVSIIKDESLTATVDNLLYVRAGWINGHDTYAAAPAFDYLPAPGASVYADVPVGSNRVNMSIVRPDGTKLDEMSTELSYVASSISPKTDPDNYQIIILANEDAEPGELETTVVWTADQRDTLISVSTAQNLIDISKDNIGTNAVGAYMDKNDIPTQAMYDMNCSDSGTYGSYGHIPESDGSTARNKARDDAIHAAQQACLLAKFPKWHHWLNAPNPIYRENIKKISFHNKSNPAQAYGVLPGGRNGNCWDISEHQSAQVIACYSKTADYLEIYLSDIEGFGAELFGDIGGFLKGVAEGLMDTATCVGTSLASFFTFGLVESKCEISFSERPIIKMQDGISLYNIDIYQEGGVTAPTNSSRLFYYTGQDTDYLYVGRQMVPRLDAAEWLDSWETNIGDSIASLGDWAAPLAMVGDWYDFLINGVLDFLESYKIKTQICIMNKYYTYGIARMDKNYSQHCGNSGEDYVDKYSNHPTKLSFNDAFFVDNVQSMEEMFAGAKFNKLAAQIRKIQDKTGNVTNMAGMFYYNNDQESFDVPNLNVAKVTNFSKMFSGARFGECVYGTTKGESDYDKCTDGVINIPNWNTSSATNMSDMFSDLSPTYNQVEENPGAKSKRVTIGNWDTSKVTDMSYMFSSAYINDIDVSSFNTTNVTTMAGMFAGTNLNSLNVSNFDTSNVVDMSKMFENLYGGAVPRPSSLSLNNFDTSKVTNMAGMFSGSSIASLDLSSFNTSNVTDMHDMFFALGVGTTLVNVSSFDTSKVTNMSWMFGNFTPVIYESTCEVEEPGTIGQAKTDTKTDYIYVPFNNSDIRDQMNSREKDNPFVGLAIKLGQRFDTIKDWDKTCEKKADADAKKKTAIQDAARDLQFSTANLDLTGFNTSSVTNMAGMFAGSKSNRVSFTPSTVKGTGFDTSEVTDMSWMFSGIAYAPIVSMPLDTSNVTKMVGMFAGLSTHQLDNKLDLTTFSSASNPDMGWMFAHSCIGEIVFSEALLDNGLPQWQIPESADNEKANKSRYIYAGAGEDCKSIGGALVSGGMNLEQAQAFMKEYTTGELASYYAALSKSGRGDRVHYGINLTSCSGGSLANCVAFSEYFVNKYTTNPTAGMGGGYGLPNGSLVVQRLIANGFADGGTVPRAYAVFSTPSGSMMCGQVKCGHTGVVLGIDAENDKIIIGEAGCSMPLSWAGAHEKKLSDFTSGKYTFAYTDEFLNMGGQ